MEEIICLANEPWGAIPSRTQHLLSRFGNARILYFSPSNDHKRVTGSKGKKVRPTVTAFTYPPYYHWMSELSDFGSIFLNTGHKMLGRFINNAAERRRFNRPLLWTTCPDQVHLLNHLQYGSLLFDCDREWDSLPPAWEGGLAQAADLVLAASPRLQQRLSPCSENITIVQNGVNHQLFSSVGATKPVGQPTFGWLGYIHDDLDLSPILHAAINRPDWKFLLIGDRSHSSPFIPQLKKLKNIEFFPRCTLPEVAELLGRCHVLVNLQRLSTAGGDIIPTRLFEYLSSGKPVITLLLPDEVEPFPDMVYSAHSPEEFLVQCQHALDESPGWVSGRRKTFASEADWSIRAAELKQVLTTAGLL